MFQKAILFVALSLTVSAYAGTPDQDPAVAKLQDEFAKASVTVTKADLKEGHEWQCTDLDAVKDTFLSLTYYYNFSDIDGLVVLSGREYLAQTAFGMSGIDGSRVYNPQDTLRVTSTHDLIDEISISAADFSNAGWQGVASVIPRRMVTDYVVCPAP